MSVLRTIRELFFGKEEEEVQESIDISKYKEKEIQVDDGFYEEHSRMLKLAEKKTQLELKGGDIYELWKGNKLIDYSSNINQMAIQNNLGKSGLYKAYQEGKPYKKDYTINKCQES